MKLFRIPDFYMPWAARCNAHLDASRAASRAWAQDAGLLVPDAVWDEATFDAADYAQITAFGHPDAAPAELELLTEWYVWLFYFDDDFCARYKCDGDVAGAKDRVGRLRGLIAVDSPGAPIVPEMIVERALADVWSRTIPTASAYWRARFVQSNHRLFDEFVWEIATAEDEAIANPLQYVEMRRGVSGTPWSADLVEHALGLELAPGLHGSRPRVLRDVFADTVGLYNDIVSYEKEQRAGELNNGVHIVHRFLDCELQEAVDLVDAIITSRLHQFEYTVLTELGPELGERGLGPLQRSTALRFVGGLQDWMAGDRVWHRVSGRYGNAGGDAAGQGAGAWSPRPFRRRADRARHGGGARRRAARAARARMGSEPRRAGAAGVVHVVRAACEPAARGRPRARTRLGRADGDARRKRRGQPASLRRCARRDAADARAADRARRWQVLANDLPSHARQCAYDRDTNSIVLVLGRLLGCGEARVLAPAGDLATARVRQFERVAAQRRSGRCSTSTRSTSRRVAACSPTSASSRTGWRTRMSGCARRALCERDMDRNGGGPRGHADNEMTGAMS